MARADRQVGEHLHAGKVKTLSIPSLQGCDLNALLTNKTTGKKQNKTKNPTKPHKHQNRGKLSKTEKIKLLCQTAAGEVHTLP